MRAMRRMRMEQERQRNWTCVRARLDQTLPEERSILSSFVQIERRSQRIRRALEQERSAFESKCALWRTRIERDVLAKPLPVDWIPQQSRVGGRSFFLNTSTGKVQEENPNLVSVRALWDARVEAERKGSAQRESDMRSQLDVAKGEEKEQQQRVLRVLANDAAFSAQLQ